MGLRPEECFRLRWEALTWSNGRHGILLVTHGKTAAARRVLPMTPRVRAVLENRWEHAGKPVDGWVWPAPTRSGHLEGSSIKKRHAKALKGSNVRLFVLYSLRHTFLTRLGESGCDSWTLARMAGHSSVAISARYVHPSEDKLLEAISRLGGHNSGHIQLEQQSASDTKLLVGKLKVLAATERCWSGRTGLPAKQFHPKRVTGVRIPPSPPVLCFQWVGLLPKAFPKNSSQLSIEKQRDSHGWQIFD